MDTDKHGFCLSVVYYGQVNSVDLIFTGSALTDFFFEPFSLPSVPMNKNDRFFSIPGAILAHASRWGKSMNRRDNWNSLLKITFITVIMGLLFSCFCLVANIRMQAAHRTTDVSAVNSGYTIPFKQRGGSQ